MKSKLLKSLLAAAMVLTMTPVSSVAALTGYEGEEWYDQIETVEVNREYAHSFFVPYQDAKTALENEKSILDKDFNIVRDFTKSDYYQTLNGEWDFHFAKNPDNRLTSSADDTIDWTGKLDDKIMVPSSIETQVDEEGNFKYADKGATPIYSNQRYPWGNYEQVNYNQNMGNGTTAKAPLVINGVGHYQRTFTLPENWDGRNVFVSFQGVDSAFYVYINGQKVGYGEDTYTADDFNITPYLVEGENTISVQVYRWSTGSYVENQDMIRLSGIFRDVFLYSKADVEIRDFFLKPELNEDYTKGTLNAEVDVRNLSNLAGGEYTVKVGLYNNKTLEKITEGSATYTLDAAKGTLAELIDDRGTRKTVTLELANPELWDADNPNLYSVLIELIDAKGNTIEAASERVGFRELKRVIINDAGQYQLQINGKKIMIRGTNRHEAHYIDGRALTLETIKYDMLTMKQNNINALRMSHYPNNVWTYALCDELGIYVCDETNAESHQGESTGAGVPSKYPIWNNSIMARTQNMVERDKNHSSVIIWSLGNEATYATYPMNENYCFYNSTMWILERDPSRIRKYERDNRYALNEDGTFNREGSMVDIYSSQYWSVSGIEGHVSNPNNKLPYIQSEYQHSMGNATGNHKEYWDVFREYPNAQGGFIWDWVDQSVVTTVSNEGYLVVHDKKNEITTDGQNASFVAGQNNTQALDGVLILPNTVKAKSNGMTIDTYINVDEGVSLNTNFAIVGNGDDGYNLKVNSQGKFEAFFNGWQAGCVTANIPEAMYDGNWHRLTVTINADALMTLYFDGEVIGTLTRNSTSDNYDENSRGVAIGDDIQYSGRAWPGDIDAVRIMNTCMSAEDIKAGMVAKDAQNVIAGFDFAEDEFEEIKDQYAGTKYWGFGGDWNDKVVNDNSFVGNGIINADRSLSPKIIEVKKVQQEINFYDEGQLLSEGKVLVVNEHTSDDLSKYNITYKVIKNDKVISEKTLALNTAADSSEVVTLDIPELGDIRGADDVFVQFVCTLKADKPWAHAGHVVAEEQLQLKAEATENDPVIDATKMDTFEEVENGEDTIEVTGKDGDNAFEVVIDKVTGYITNYTYAGKQLMTQGPVPNYYRAMIENDTYLGTDNSDLKHTADLFEVESIEVEQLEKMVKVTVTGAIPTAIETPNTITYTIFPNGQIVVNNTATIHSEKALTRVGMKISVPEEFENFTYYGRGPWENYSDRNTGSFISTYKTTVDEIEALNKYLRPQENGNHTDVRYAAVRNEAGVGFMVHPEEIMETSLSKYEDEAMDEQRHMYQVAQNDGYLVFNIDQVQRGLGGAICGPEPLAQYKLENNATYSHTFRIVPFVEATDDELMEESKTNLSSLNPIQNITLGEMSIGFTPNVSVYDVKLPKNSFVTVPQINVVKTSEDVVVEEFEQPTQLPATVVVKASSAFGSATYTINISEAEAIYASDMEWLEDIGGYFANTRDASDSNALSLYVNGVVTPFEKGIGAHADSRITIDLTGKGFNTFSAIAGINSNQRPGAPSDAIFRVYVDGALKYEQQILAGESYPVEVDVTDAKTITLVTDKNGADANDHTTWADAKFTSKEVEKPTVNKDALNAKIAEVENTKADAYTEESYAVFAEALEAAKAVSVKEDVTQDDINEALTALEDAYKALVKKSVEKPFPFTDVSNKQWYYGVINEAYQLGLMTGATDTLFKPNANMNRGMVAIVFHRMEGSKKVEYSKVFPDVANKQYYTTSVLWAKQTGVINGYKDGTFKPLRNVSREEMATMIYNFARYKGLDMSASKDITYFSDYAKITPYARVTLQWAVEKGLMSGKDNGTRLDPLGTATRAECSKMLVQAYKVIYK